MAANETSHKGLKTRRQEELGFRLDLSPLLLRRLEPLVDLAEKKDVAELCCNEFGRVLVERFGSKGWQEEAVPWLNSDWAWDLGRFFANELDLPFSEELPILSVQLPGGHRLQMDLGANMPKGIALTVRVKRKFAARWEDFGLSADHEWARFIRMEIEAGKGFLVSGGTYSGKTTLLNMLLRLVPGWYRILTAEDVGELDVPHRNWVPFMLSRLVAKSKRTYLHVLDSIIRHRPDGVAWGEISIENAFPFVRVMNTGHECCFSSVHANSPWLALRAIHQNVQLAGYNPAGVIEYLAETIAFIVQVKRSHDGRRVITDVVQPGQLPQLAEWKRGNVVL